MGTHREHKALCHPHGEGLEGLEGFCPDGCDAAPVWCRCSEPWRCKVVEGWRVCQRCGCAVRDGDSSTRY